MGRNHHASFKQPGELFGEHRPAEEVPLRLVTLMGVKKVELRLGLDAVRHHPQLQAFGPC